MFYRFSYSILVYIYIYIYIYIWERPTRFTLFINLFPLTILYRFRTNYCLSSELISVHAAYSILPCIYRVFICSKHVVDNSFIDTNLIHNFYINYIKLSSSTCFERHPLIFRRSMMFIVHVCSLWYSHNENTRGCIHVQLTSLTSWRWADDARNM